MDNPFLKRKRHYTYIYFDEQMVPYYVGKGIGRRAYKRHANVAVPQDRSRILVQHCASKDEAFEMEKLLIGMYGCKYDGSGCLENKNPGRMAVMSGKIRTLMEQGRKNVENGHMRRLNASFTHEERQYAGHLSGRTAVESGQLDSLRTIEHQKMASQYAHHTRWHVNRGIISATCPLCGAE